MIYTGYYAKLNKYNEAGLEPVAISGKRPDFYEGLYYPDFAPCWETFKKWKNKEITNEGYTKEYRAYLETLDESEIEFDFQDYDAGRKDIILLCYEKPEDFCHRHVLADWLEEKFGWKVEEFKELP